MISRNPSADPLTLLERPNFSPNLSQRVEFGDYQTSVDELCSQLPAFGNGTGFATHKQCGPGVEQDGISLRAAIQPGQHSSENQGVFLLVTPRQIRQSGVLQRETGWRQLGESEALTLIEFCNRRVAECR